ncbi:McrB family protein [Mycoplasma yeatsii]|uniref:ATPase dynein-related AAA domain-containing protein n=1 Tax=Mycoplasma yeatsii TaxID=51365 RepID=A0ABU0NE61_9MOLU|nr:AAA family ATPase [Mycoplasma yeatsii]MDQ0567727.1 hypothetical protein [Mycoplasma yeatsii]
MNSDVNLKPFLKEINVEYDAKNIIDYTENRGYKIQTDSGEEIAVFVWPTKEEIHDTEGNEEKLMAQAWAEFYEYCNNNEIKFFSIMLDESEDKYFYDLNTVKLKKDHNFTFDTIDLIFRANEWYFKKRKSSSYMSRLEKIFNNYQKFKKKEKIHNKQEKIYEGGKACISLTVVDKNRFIEYAKSKSQQFYKSKYTWSEVANILNKEESEDIKEKYKQYLTTEVQSKKSDNNLSESTVGDYVDALSGNILNYLLRKTNVNKISIYTIDNKKDFEVVKTKIIENVSFKFLGWNDLYTSLQHYENFLEKNQSTDLKKLNISHQIIYFGAPGTGKSYELNKLVKDNFKENYERVTFHPSYMYGHFVGAFKPFTKNETITYKYVPGILIKQLIKAYEKPNENFALVIEEINRANVSAVFGDIFQLLDRDENGDSQYLISTSEELQQYLQENINQSKLEQEVKDKLKPKFEKLYLPKNFYILATMNSADQGVMPLDSAFKRRWEFKYLSIDKASDENKEEFNNYEFEVNSKIYKWNEFRTALNDELSKLHISEDKLIGPYFISSKILKESKSNPEKLTEVIKDKVLMYLYDDVARAHRSELFREGTYKTYSKLCEEFNKDCLGLFRHTLVLKDIREKTKEENKEENKE